jgi:hypothetical protein
LKILIINYYNYELGKQVADHIYCFWSRDILSRLPFNEYFELVEKEYYKSELRYQDVIDGSNRANALSSVVKLEQTSDGLILQLPEEMKDQVISGSILFYCAYNAKQDRKFVLKTNMEGMQVFEKGQIPPGTYTLKVNWDMNGKNYYTEKTITVA